MNRNIGLAVVVVGVIVLLLTGTASSFLGIFQVWLAAEHPVSGLVLIIGALVIAIGTKVLWR